MALMKLVGAPVKRVEDPRFLRGQAQYVDDIRLPGILHVAFLRSPHAHARIVSVDTSAALRLPGVRRVFTGPEVDAALGVRASIRASFYLYNDHEDVARLLDALHEARRFFRRGQDSQRPAMPASTRTGGRVGR